MPSWDQLIIICVSVTALIVCIKTVTSFAPFKWVYRTLITDPASHRLNVVVDDRIEPYMKRNEAAMAELKAELTSNGGSSLKDLVGRTAANVGELTSRMSRIESQIGNID